MKKVIIYIIIIILSLAILFGTIDFFLVNSFELPIFCINFDKKDDGGSGNYIGLGYSFEIDGNFMPDDELPGVTKFNYKILGINIKTGIRD